MAFNRRRLPSNCRYPQTADGHPPIAVGHRPTAVSGGPNMTACMVTHVLFFCWLGFWVVIVEQDLPQLEKRLAPLHRITKSAHLPGSRPKGPPEKFTRALHSLKGNIPTHTETPAAEQTMCGGEACQHPLPPSSFRPGAALLDNALLNSTACQAAVHACPCIRARPCNSVTVSPGTIALWTQLLPQVF